MYNKNALRIYIAFNTELNIRMMYGWKEGKKGHERTYKYQG